MTYDETLQLIKGHEHFNLPSLQPGILDELAHCYRASVEQGYEPCLKTAVYHLQRLTQVLHPKEVSKTAVSIIIVILEMKSKDLSIDMEAARSFVPPVWEKEQ